MRINLYLPDRLGNDRLKLPQTALKNQGRSLSGEMLPHIENLMEENRDAIQTLEKMQQ